MLKLVFSLLTNFYKSFDNGIILVVISSMIPILLLGMTVTVDEAFAQSQVILSSATSVTASMSDRGSPSQLTPGDLRPVFVGEVDVKNLKKPTRGGPTVFEIPYLTKDPQPYGKLKINPAAIRSDKSFATPLPQPAYSVPTPAAVTQLTGFDGLKQAGYIPPDVEVATGPNHVVEMVNSAFRIWTKQGVFVEGNTLASFFLTGSVDPGDPKIFYDSFSGRWFASALDDRTSVRFAVSATNDPTGNWLVYDIDYSGSWCPDQPKIGSSDDKFVIASNIFNARCNGGFVGTHFFVFDKNEMFSGTINNILQFGPDGSRFSITPAESLSSNSDLFLVSVHFANGNEVELYSLNGAVPSTTLTIDALPMQSSSLPPNAVQQGTSNLIDTGDMRIQDSAWFQGKLWFSFNDSCLLTGDTQTRSCVHLVQIDTATPAVTQDIRFGAVGSYYYYPAVSIDQFGGLGVVFGFSDATTFPSVAVTGQPAGSTPNTVENPLTIKQGSDFNPTSRYGDYFEAATDPSNPSIIWVGGQYHDSAPWSTWIDSINVSDTDGDGVINVNDNCPDDANPNQEDADNDGIGDVCDTLPLEPNRQCVNQTGDWNNAGSWFPVGIPSSTERLVMINCDLAIQAGETVVVGNILDVDSSSILNLAGDITVTDELNLSGTYNVQSGGIYNNNAGGLTIVKSGGTFDVHVGGTVNDAGIHVTRGGATTNVFGQWNEQGSLNNVFGIFNVASGGVYHNEAGGLTNVKPGGTFDVQSGGIVNDVGFHSTRPGGTTNVSGQWNEQGSRNELTGTFNVASGGVYDNEAGGFTNVKTGGTFDVQSGGIVNDVGFHSTRPGGTTNVSGQWNEQGSRNDVTGTFNVAAGGVYHNESGGLTNVKTGGTFDVQSGGTVNDVGDHYTRPGGTTNVSGQWNEQGGRNQPTGTFNVASGGVYDNEVGGFTNVINGGTFDVQSGGTVNDVGLHSTRVGSTTNVFGQWNEQGSRNELTGTFNVASGGVYHNEAGGLTNVKPGGTFDVQSGGIVNDVGFHSTRPGGTTNVSGQWNEQGSRNELTGTFNVASGGVYDNEAGGFTNVKNGASFNLQIGGKVNNFGLFQIKSGGIATLDDEYDNNVGSRTKNFGTINLDCNGMFNDLGGLFLGTPIIDICP